MAPRFLEENFKENLNPHSYPPKCRSEQAILHLTDITNKPITKIPKQKPLLLWTNEPKLFKQKTQRKNKTTVKKIPTIHNIDLNDQHDPQLVSEYLPCIFPYIFQLEQSSPILPNFLLHSSITPAMRSILLDWLNDVQIMFKLLPETLYMATFMLDSFLQKERKKIPKEKLQLVGSACMFTAAKAEETQYPSVSDFVYISDGAFTARSVRAMERRILRSINFNLFRPPPITFLRRFSKAAEVNEEEKHVHMASYVVDTALLNYSLAHHPPSLLAASSLLLCLLLLNPSSSPSSCWSPTLKHYSRYSVDELEPVVNKLAEVMVGARYKDLKAVNEKYEAKERREVALMQVWKGERLHSLAKNSVDSEN